MDCQVRRAEPVGPVPESVMADVLAKLAPLLHPD